MSGDKVAQPPKPELDEDGWVNWPAKGLRIVFQKGSPIEIDNRIFCYGAAYNAARRVNDREAHAPVRHHGGYLWPITVVGLVLLALLLIVLAIHYGWFDGLDLGIWRWFQGECHPDFYQTGWKCYPW